MRRINLFFKKYRALRGWDERSYSPPTPRLVKEAVILKHGFLGGTWVETGTHLGDTAELLSSVSDVVHTIEPADEYFNLAQGRLKRFQNVRVYHGASEDTLEQILREIGGDVSFWLDGHYSAEKTFKGKADTPIIEELKLISKYRSRFHKLAVLVDDVRCFDPTISEFADYPAREFLVHWAVEQNLSWTIEHDIFIARSRI